MSFRFDHSACLGEGGLDPKLFTDLREALVPVLAELGKGSGRPDFLSIDPELDDISAALELATAWRKTFRDVVILGTGGSSLGARTLCALADPNDGPRLHFLENVDPLGFAAVVDRIDWEGAALLVVSKSGSTAETLGQALVLLPRLAERFDGTALTHRLAVVTEPGNNPLATLAARFGARRIPHHPGIGGRFSVLSVTGCLPALLAGLDVAALRRGALSTLERNLAAGADAAAAEGAALAVGLARSRGVQQSVLLSYADRLADFGLWYRQLWAESLGKGGQGTTPIRAMGTVDQHSQLQLYLDGPNDKLITLMTVESAGSGPVMDAGLAFDCGLDALAGRHLGDLLHVCARATGESLIARRRALRWLTLERLDMECLGGLFMHFMLETILAAALLSVDPFDQPAVEEGKVLARKYLQDMTPKESEP